MQTAYDIIVVVVVVIIIIIVLVLHDMYVCKCTVGSTAHNGGRGEGWSGARPLRIIISLCTYIVYNNIIQKRIFFPSNAV